MSPEASVKSELAEKNCRQANNYNIANWHNHVRTDIIPPRVMRQFVAVHFVGVVESPTPTKDIEKLNKQRKSGKAEQRPRGLGFAETARQPPIYLTDTDGMFVHGQSKRRDRRGRAVFNI